MDYMEFNESKMKRRAAVVKGLADKELKVVALKSEDPCVLRVVAKN